MPYHLHFLVSEFMVVPFDYIVMPEYLPVEMHLFSHH